MIRTCLLLTVLSVVAGCGGSSSPAGDDASGSAQPVSIIGVESFEVDVPVVYELSPDGRHVAIDIDDRLCLFAVDRIGTTAATPETASACVDGVPALIDARWSPDSTKIVFGTDTMRMLDSAPLQLISIDGTVVTIAEPTPGDGDVVQLDGAPFHPVFVDADTVAFGRVVGEPATFEVRVVDVSSGEERFAGMVPRNDDRAGFPFPRGSWESSGGELLVAMGAFDQPVSLWTLDLASGEATQVDTPPTRPSEDREPNWRIHDRTGRLGLVVDLDTMGSFGGRSDSPAWWLYDFESGASGAVGLDIDSASDDEYVRFAAVSPDEATIAVVVVTRGDGAETVEILAAPTADVLAGSADWAGIDLPEDALGGADLTDSVRSLSWTGYLLYKSSGAIYSIATG